MKTSLGNFTDDEKLRLVILPTKFYIVGNITDEVLHRR